jgi:hypothetical protein
VRAKLKATVKLLEDATGEVARWRMLTSPESPQKPVVHQGFFVDQASRRYTIHVRRTATSEAARQQALVAQEGASPDGNPSQR